MRQLVKIFKALGDPNRLRILKMLEIRPLCVCEITSILNLATSTVSRHLSLLRDAEFIIDEKKGKWVTYRLNDKTSEFVADLLPLLKKWLPDDPVILQDQQKVKEVDRASICNT